MASSNSLLDAVAVPRFITTRPPAKFANRVASAVSVPAASAAVKVAITVSPAPVTSTTWSEPKIGTANGTAPFSNATIPSRPRVMTSDSRSICFIRRSPAANSFLSSWPILMLNDSSTSGSLGVAAVTVVGNEKRVGGGRVFARRVYQVEQNGMQFVQRLRLAVHAHNLLAAGMRHSGEDAGLDGRNVAF